MKKSLLSLAGIALLAAVGGIVNAQLDVSELFSEGLPLVEDAYTKVLNDYDTSRGYVDTTVSCDVNNGIVIESPLVEDSTIEKATTYNLFLSPYRMSQIKDGDSIDTSKIIMKKVEISSDDANVRFEIPSTEVDSNTAYYGFISPIDVFDYIGTPSKEVCFKLSNDVCLLDTACDTLKTLKAPEKEEVVEQHGSAKDCEGMKMANVTHTLKDGVVTLKWTAIDGDTVEVAIMDPEKEVWKSLGTARMKDEKFEYKMKWDGEQNFELTNGCEAVRYKVDGKATEDEPEIKVTPATGPAENILYIAIAAIVLYGAYVLFFRKSEN